MIVLPIGSYFASVNTLFKGAFAAVARDSIAAHLTSSRQRNICWRAGSSHGKRSLDWLCHRGIPG